MGLSLSGGKRVRVPKSDSLEERLSAIAHRVSVLNAEMLQTDGQLSALERQRDVIVAECKRLGVEPANLDQVILDQERDLIELASKLEEMLGGIATRRDAVQRERGVIE